MKVERFSFRLASMIVIVSRHLDWLLCVPARGTVMILS